MNDPTTPSATAPAAPQTIPASIVTPMVEPQPHTKAGVSDAEAAKMAAWARQDMASGKISPEQAATIFAELGTPLDQRVTPPETRSEEEQFRDAHFPIAKPEDYSIRYGLPGQSLPMTTELKQFDTAARTWLSGAEFDRNFGNALVNQIEKVTQETHKMTPGELESYGWAEYAKLEKIHGDKLVEKLQSAGFMVEELDKKQPGLKNLLRSKGIGDNALIASLLIQQAHHYHARKQGR